MDFIFAESSRSEGSVYKQLVPHKLAEQPLNLNTLASRSFLDIGRAKNMFLSIFQESSVVPIFHELLNFFIILRQGNTSEKLEA